VTGADLECRRERRRLVRFDPDEVRGSGIPGHDAADQPAAETNTVSRWGSGAL